jgi:hypothetical protein
MPTSVSTRTSGSLNPTRQQLDELDALLKRMLELPVNQLEEAERAAAEAEVEPTIDEPPPPPEPVAVPQAAEPGLPPESPAVSYMVVETASPRPIPPASGFEPRPSPLPPHPVPETSEDAAHAPEPPVPATTETEEERPADSEVWVPLRSTWQPSPQTWPPLADSWHQANGTTAPSDSPQESMPREILVPQPATPSAPLPIESVQRSIPLQEQATPPSHDKVDTPPLPASSPTSAEPQLSLTAEDAPVVVPRAVLPLLWFNQGFDACMAPLGAVGRWLCGIQGRQTLGLAGLALLVLAAIILGAGMTWTR